MVGKWEEVGKGDKLRGGEEGGGGGERTCWICLKFCYVCFYR